MYRLKVLSLCVEYGIHLESEWTPCEEDELAHHVSCIVDYDDC